MGRWICWLCSGALDTGRHRHLVLRHRARFLVMQKGMRFFWGGAFTTEQAAQRAPQKTTGLPLAGPDQARRGGGLPLKAETVDRKKRGQSPSKKHPEPRPGAGTASAADKPGRCRAGVLLRAALLAMPGHLHVGQMRSHGGNHAIRPTRFACLAYALRLLRQSR
jgi:hypothetical protein